ncbi:uncharacterized protein si:dkey-94l16.4 [Cheilinus undulatus]|uniref:uncharacterized protein si:dkey-94l16.4 n=1 Tax=Cheilinus undulatus TaxID=241271 RepID=UPI001BD5B35D|nr:uncharacterized protein si:dkey-94l16.4 [Cheilinus undulatus]XP_041671635.1 uncharacterized protein si:dkey-94l16.4 [Cheilinus undulatus]
MEEPPGSLDDLQPQDLSTTSLPTVIDLTRRADECVLSPTSLDALRRVTSPAWYQNSATSSPASSSSITLQPGDQIQPDNAFSHTTVTLSYVSRSHVFSTHDSLSFSVPPLSRLSLHAPMDSEKGLGETRGFALNQHYVEQEEGPVELSAQSLLQSLSREFNGGDESCSVDEDEDIGDESCSGDGHVEDESCSVDGHVEDELCSVDGHVEDELCSVDAHVEDESCSVVGHVGEESGSVDEHVGDESCGVDEHVGDESSGVHVDEHDRDEPCGGGDDVRDELCQVNADECGGDEQRTGSSLENGQEVCAVSDSESEVIFLLSKDREQIVAPGNRATRDMSRDYMSPLEDPVSPSQDGVDDVFTLPQASCSPSGDDAYLETTEDAEWDGQRTGASDINDTTGDENRETPRAELQPLIDLTEDDSDHKTQPVVHVNGNTKTLKRVLNEKRLPTRSGRGMRLESIVMNINSSRSKVSACVRTKTKSQSTVSESKLTEQTDGVPGGRKRRASASSSVKTKTEAVSPRKRCRNTNSTSDSEIKNSKKAQSPRSAVHRHSKKEAEPLLPAEPSGENHVVRSSPTKPPPPSSSSSPSPKKSRRKPAGQKTSPTAKTPRRKRRKKLKQSHSSSSVFAPKEPEIKLKYVNYREERRDLRTDTFSPFVRVQRQPSSPSLCSVINYPEEVRPQHRKQQAHPATSFVPAAVPSTSCLVLGRASTHGQHRRSLVCCLCGLPANAMDLGDLHGPYYPEGYQLSAKTPASVKEGEDEFSDSDSSSCSVRRQRRKCSTMPRPLRAHLKSPRWSGDGTSSPSAKRARTGVGSADVEDWYSPPVLPLEPCEYWLHEDCGIWSAGVFLVKGRVYGLEEAVKVSHETTCSACQESGATMGCFFKGCPNKYHYRCALQSDCVLIEENFSMKCKKHKNKTFKAPAGTRCDDR